MTLDRLKQTASHLTGLAAPPHPLDPLSASEIEQAVAIVRQDHSDVFFNAVTLWEPRKVEMMAWVADPKTTPRPHRVADVVAIGRGSKVYDGIVDLTEQKLIGWELTEGVQPLVFPTDFLLELLQLTESDYDGRSPNCRDRCSQRPEGH